MCVCVHVHVHADRRVRLRRYQQHALKKLGIGCADTLIRSGIFLEALTARPALKWKGLYHRALCHSGCWRCLGSDWGSCPGPGLWARSKGRSIIFYIKLWHLKLDILVLKKRHWRVFPPPEFRIPSTNRSYKTLGPGSLSGFFLTTASL